MIDIRKFDSLGHADHGWLDARHHFSFANYYDPNRMGWGRIRVWNDDRIAARSGFPPPEPGYMATVAALARELFADYGYREMRVPLVERAELFQRSIGEHTDIVEKEMYSFEDKGGRSLTLRPESTAAVCRAYVEHGMQQWPQPVRLYYVGPQFRYERPQKGRHRQFHQIGAELLGGSRGPDADVEILVVLVHFLRETLGLTGTHVGCDTSQCGACTVLVDGRATKSCTVLAAQADGATVITIEGLARDGELHPLQVAFRAEHALQCGFCTPGLIMTAADLLARDPDPSDGEIRHALEGNLCRCTGYQNIVSAVKRAAADMRARIRDRAAHLRDCATQHENAAESLERHLEEVDRLKEAITDVERKATSLTGDAATRFTPPPAGHKDWLAVALPGR